MHSLIKNYIDLKDYCIDIYYRWLWKQTIKSLRDGFGADCEDFDKDCISCRAGQVITFLDDAIDTNEWFYDKIKQC